LLTDLLTARAKVGVVESVCAGGRDRDRTCDFCRVKSRTAGSMLLLLGIRLGQRRDSTIRSGPFVTAVVPWTMPQMCPKRIVRTVSAARWCQEQADHPASSLTSDPRAPAFFRYVRSCGKQHRGRRPCSRASALSRYARWGGNDPDSLSGHGLPGSCGSHSPYADRKLAIGSGAIAAAQTMGTRCSQSGSWRRSGRW
jgi:hypothetical protein